MGPGSVRGGKGRGPGFSSDAALQPFAAVQARVNARGSLPVAFSAFTGASAVRQAARLALADVADIQFAANVRA